MKYIRTKDGKIFNLMDLIKWNKNQGLVENEISFWNSAYRYPEKHKQGLKARILKQADTIEELCDEFVVFDKEQPNGKLLYYKGFENLKKEFIDFEKDKEKVVVCGAIWTDKGLIYVAKMNDKGELELI